MFTCSTCNKTLSSKSSLNYHRKTNKSCLKLQGNNLEDFTCSECETQFSQKHCLTRHLKVCPPFLTKSRDQEIKEYKKIIKEQKKEIEKYKKQIKKYETALEKARTINITNNNITNIYIQEMPAFTKTLNDINQIFLENYTKEMFCKGIIALSNFILEHILFDQETGKYTYVLTDSARLMFRYKDENGIIYKDEECNMLLTNCNKSFKQIAPIHLNAILQDIENNNPEYLSLQNRIPQLESNTFLHPDLRKEIVNIIRKKLLPRKN